MRSLCVRIATVFLALNVGACAMFETRQTKLLAVKTVGIISAVGDEITVSKGGVTGLHDRGQSFQIQSWGIDDLIVQRATEALKGRFQVEPVNYRRAAFATIEDSPIPAVNLVNGDPFEKLVRTDVSPQGLDAYIVITKAKANFAGSARKVGGIGFLRYKTVLESYDQIYALYEIRVVDGKTFDLIEKVVAPPVDDVGAIKIAGPSRTIDGSLAPADGDPTRNEKLRGVITDLLVQSLSSAFSDMYLTEIR